jgi:hypothetical protein
MATDTDFGIDLSLTDDLDPRATTVTGTRLVAEAVYRRITCPRGALIDDPDYGIDVRDFLHKGMTTGQRASIPGLVRCEILKDERVSSVEIDVTTSTTGFTLRIRCTTDEGPFTLTTDVSTAAATLAEITT